MTQSTIEQQPASVSSDPATADREFKGTDEVIEYLVQWHRDNFQGAHYADYIRNQLATDFAWELALTLSRSNAPQPESTPMTGDELSRYEALEREHLGDPDKRTGIYAPKQEAANRDQLLRLAEVLKQVNEPLPERDFSSDPEAAQVDSTALEDAVYALQWHYDNPNKDDATDEPRKRDARAIRALKRLTAPVAQPAPLKRYDPEYGNSTVWDSLPPIEMEECKHGEWVRFDDVALLRGIAAQPERESGDRVCQEVDGCPTELAVLKRFWRASRPTASSAPVQPEAAQPAPMPVAITASIDTDEFWGVLSAWADSRGYQGEKRSQKAEEAEDAVLAHINAWHANNAALPLLAQPERETGQVYGIIDPDYGRWYTIIRKIAWEEGYAIGMHGSFTRDLDLIAVPWEAGRRGHDPEHLVRRICQATNAGLRSLESNPGLKPYGRLVYTLVATEFGDPRFVDLSIMPALPPAPTAPEKP